jgi:hypothetical protein
VQIGKARPIARPVAVIGSTAEDFQQNTPHRSGQDIKFGE